MHGNPLVVPTLGLSVAFFFFGLFSYRRTSSVEVRALLLLPAILLAVPGSLFVLYYTHLFDGAAWFYWFRALPFTELTASGSGFAAGIFHAWHEPDTWGKKLLAPCALTVLVFIPFVKSILDPINLSQLHDRCEGEVCLQSTFSTCGPASAATIFKTFGRDVSEKDLARESFTSRGGTESWYLARAIRRRGFSTEFLIQPQDQTSLPSPAIAGVVFPRGAGHFIAVLNETPNQVTLADPLKGKLVINRAELNNYYRFTGFFLVVHPSNQKQVAPISTNR